MSRPESHNITNEARENTGCNFDWDISNNSKFSQRNKNESEKPHISVPKTGKTVLLCASTPWYTMFTVIIYVFNIIAIIMVIKVCVPYCIIIQYITVF